jgi:uncharacterized membrane protein YccC
VFLWRRRLAGLHLLLPLLPGARPLLLLVGRGTGAGHLVATPLLIVLRLLIGSLLFLLIGLWIFLLPVFLLLKNPQYGGLFRIKVLLLLSWSPLRRSDGHYRLG